VEIDEPAGQAWCLACACTVALPQRGDACPQCGGYQLQATGGTGLRIVDMLVEDSEAPAGTTPLPPNNEERQPCV